MKRLAPLVASLAALALVGCPEKAPAKKKSGVSQDARDEAKRLLDEAGVKDLKVELLNMDTPRPYFPEPKQTALLLQDDLKKIGIDCSLATLTWEEYLAKTREGAFELCIMGWTGDTKDPDNFLYVLLGKDNIGQTNICRFADPVYNKLCLDAESEIDDTKRAQLYKDAQKIVREQRPMLPLVHADQLAACSTRVKNLKLHPTGRREFQSVTLDTPGEPLIFGRGSDSVTLDPPRADDGESVAVIDNVFDGLVRYSDDAKKIEPCLAQSWERSPDGKTWTFHLEKNVKFQDGTEFDADAVVFTFERILNDKHPYREPGFQNTALFAPIAKVEAKGPSIVVFTLSRPVAAFLDDLTIYTARIVSPAAMKKLGANEFATHPVGTGAYKLKSWEREQKIVLEANDSYFRGKPSTKEVILVAIKENATRLNMLKAGQIHAMDGVSPVAAKDIESDPKLQLLRQAGMNLGYLAFNCEKKPWDDVRVRRAVALAIDAKRIVATNLQGMGQVAKSPVPVGVFGWDAGEEDAPSK